MSAAQVGVKVAGAAGFAVLQRLPPAVACWAYGSAAKPQAGRSKSETPMLDLLVVVADAAAWHADNLRRNRRHYSALGALGPAAVARYQRSLAAKVYYNTLIPLPELDLTFKYGAITSEDLVEDLTQWRYLYLAGRLHKPVTPILEPSDVSLKGALESNLDSAVRAALLLLPERFSPYDLYYAVSNLSYSGDFRMIFGENKNKVKNIVMPQIEEFHLLYEQPLMRLKDFIQRTEDKITQDVSSDAKYQHLSNLPSHLRKTVLKIASKNDSTSETDTLKAVSSKNSNKIVQRALQNIVWNSSVTQSIKAILPAGFIKSLSYSFKKIKKMFV